MSVYVLLEFPVFLKLESLLQGLEAKLEKVDKVFIPVIREKRNKKDINFKKTSSDIRSDMMSFHVLTYPNPIFAI